MLLIPRIQDSKPNKLCIFNIKASWHAKAAKTLTNLSDSCVRWWEVHRSKCRLNAIFRSNINKGNIYIKGAGRHVFRLTQQVWNNPGNNCPCYETKSLSTMIKLHCCAASFCVKGAAYWQWVCWWQICHSFSHYCLLRWAYHPWCPPCCLWCLK